jgi:hypothetical protein
MGAKADKSNLYLQISFPGFSEKSPISAISAPRSVIRTLRPTRQCDEIRLIKENTGGKGDG